MGCEKPVEKKKTRAEERAAQSDKAKATGRFYWWFKMLSVRANTKSEARARIKDALNLDRLPPSAKVIKGTVEGPHRGL